MTVRHFELFFRSLQKKRADDLKRVEDAIANLNQRIEAAEKLVKEGNKLLKLCVPKINQALFLQGKQKIELGQKRNLELKSELASEKKRRRNCPQRNDFLFSFFVLSVILNINDAKILEFQFIFDVFFLFNWSVLPVQGVCLYLILSSVYVQNLNQNAFLVFNLKFSLKQQNIFCETMYTSFSSFKAKYFHFLITIEKHLYMGILLKLSVENVRHYKSFFKLLLT